MLHNEGFPDQFQRLAVGKQMLGRIGDDRRRYVRPAGEPFFAASVNQSFSAA